MIDKQNIPGHWQIRKIDELGHLLRGVNYRKDEATLIETKGYLPILRGNNINSHLNFDDLVYVKEKNISEEQLIKKGDIVFAMSSGSKHLVGKSAKALKDFKGSFGAFCGVFRPNNKINQDFVAYFFQSPFYKRTISEISKGTNINNLKREHILGLDCPLPTLPEQQVIVSKIEELFSELDKGKEQLEIARQQLKTYRQSLLKWAFEGIDKKIVLSELAHIIGGVTKGRKLDGKETVDLPYLRVANVQDGYLDLSEIKNITVLKSDKEKYHLEYEDVLFTEGGDKDKLGRGTVWKNEIADCIHQNHIFRARIYERKLLSPKYLTYYTQSPHGKSYFYKHAKQTVNLASINKGILSNLPVPICNIQEQNNIVEKLESKLSICDRLEKTIEQSLLQAETLRQSILKKAFEGKLVLEKTEKQETKVIQLYQPRNEYFYQMQVLGLIAKASRQKQVQHGEMTMAKYAYLTDKLFDVPTFYEYQRWHLGPFPPAIKKAINNKQYFKKTAGEIEVQNEATLFKSRNPYEQQIENAVNELTAIFSKYTGQERSRKTELLATVCKVIEDIQTTEIGAVRKSLKEWKIELKNDKHKNKAEKFTEKETLDCIKFMEQRGWDKKLLN